MEAFTKSPSKICRNLLKILQHPKGIENCHDSFNSLWWHCGDEVFETLRFQTDQFSSIYPLLIGIGDIHVDWYAHKWRLLQVLDRCAQSSVSANLLAKETRVWAFIVGLFADTFGIDPLNDDLYSKKNNWFSCSPVYGLIRCLLLYVTNVCWEFAVEHGLLQHLLVSMSKNQPRGCNSLGVIFVIGIMLSRPVIQESIYVLGNGDLFALLEQVIPKSGHLLKPTPRCPQCGLRRHENTHAENFVQVFLCFCFFALYCVRVYVFFFNFAFDLVVAPSFFLHFN